MDEQLIKDIRLIVDEKYVETWYDLEPTIYYKNGSPYGMITTMELNGILYIASTVNHVDSPFTVDMLKFIKKNYMKRKICLITDVKHKQDMIRGVLDKYEFVYGYLDDIMYSFNTNIKE